MLLAKLLLRKRKFRDFLFLTKVFQREFKSVTMVVLLTNTFLGKLENFT